MIKKSRYGAKQNAWEQLDYDAYLIHCSWMERAIALAKTAGDLNEVPVGAVIIDEKGSLLAAAANRKTRDNDPTAHAEIIAIRSATRIIGTPYLSNCTLYVTLEPCPMCAGAIIHSRLGLLVYGADDLKTGAIRSVANLPDSYCSNHHLPVLPGIKESHCRQQLQQWFGRQR